MKDLFIELGCEELPAKTLKKIVEDFASTLMKDFQKELSTTAESLFCKTFITPRRIAILVMGLPTHKEPEEIKSLPKTAAFDKEGNPTPALLAVKERMSSTKNATILIEKENDAYLYFKQPDGEFTEKIIPEILKRVLYQTMPLKDRMRWGNFDFSFIRPVHWIVLLFGDKVIETEIFGIKTNRYTKGHRFLHPKPILINQIKNPEKDYEMLLEKEGKVIADFQKRREKIHQQLLQSTKVIGCNLIDKNEQSKNDFETLLDEVTGLVEWPVVLMGDFDPLFLDIPKEALISAMITHQKCFPLIDDAGKLLPKYLMVSNIESTDPQTVIEGNNRVMQARLADAAFYYRVDKEITLHLRKEDLKKVVFQQGLGNLWDKSKRIAILAQEIARNIQADTIYAERAALLCKADLLTQMVGEFPELQGIMGRYYALHDSEPEAVATAIEEHYYPRKANDILPSTLEGIAVALADRIDTLVGIFGVGKRPTGDKDPFGLRRQANAILRIIIEKELNLDLQALINYAEKHYTPALTQKDLSQTLQDFFLERLRAWYQEQGINPRVFEAVRAVCPLSYPVDFHKRILAVNYFRTLSEAEALAAANKRVKNILIKSDINSSSSNANANANANTKDTDIKKDLLTIPTEKQLWDKILEKEKNIENLLNHHDYTPALQELALLKEPVDNFFNEVMVMVEDEKLRNNRLRLLNKLRNLFLKIADISEL